MAITGWNVFYTVSLTKGSREGREGAWDGDRRIMQAYGFYHEFGWRQISQLVKEVFSQKWVGAIGKNRKRVQEGKISKVETYIRSFVQCLNEALHVNHRDIQRKQQAIVLI